MRVSTSVCQCLWLWEAEWRVASERKLKNVLHLFFSPWWWWWRWELLLRWRLTMALNFFCNEIQSTLPASLVRLSESLSLASVSISHTHLLSFSLTWKVGGRAKVGGKFHCAWHSHKASCLPWASQKASQRRWRRRRSLDRGERGNDHLNERSTHTSLLSFSLSSRLVWKERFRFIGYLIS